MSIFDKLINITHKGLKIIIIGGGKIGSTLADKLTLEGNDITFIDNDPEVVEDLSATLDIRGIHGNGSSYTTLMDAGIESADLLIAVTASDELNLLCCALAKKVGSCASIARVRNPDYSEELSYLRDRLDISLIINPELEVAREFIHFKLGNEIDQLTDFPVAEPYRRIPVNDWHITHGNLGNVFRKFPIFHSHQLLISSRVKKLVGNNLANPQGRHGQNNNCQTDFRIIF